MASMNGVDRVSTFKIFVKNLPDGVTQEELKLIFEEYGRVVECEIFRNVFAFVHMEDDACGKYAIGVLNGRNVRGNTIVVEQSHQTDQGPKIPSTRLCVRNIPASLKAVELRSLFKKYGLVLGAEITNGTGIVNLEAMGDLRTAINEVNGFVYDGHSLTVEPMMNTADTYSPKKTQPTQKTAIRPGLMQLPRSGAARPMPLMSELRLRPLLPEPRPTSLLPNPLGRIPQNLRFNSNSLQGAAYNQGSGSLYNAAGNNSSYRTRTPYTKVNQTYGGLRNQNTLAGMTAETDYDYNYDEEYEGQLDAETEDDYDSEYQPIEEPQQFGLRAERGSSSWQSPVTEDRILRDPRRALVMPQPQQMQQRGMIRPLMGHSMDLPTQRGIRPLLPMPMQQPVRSPFPSRLLAPQIQKPSSTANIEPLFLRRHEILHPNQASSSSNYEDFYEDEPSQNTGFQQQQGRFTYRDSGNFQSNNSRPPLLQQFHDNADRPPTRYQQQERLSTVPPRTKIGFSLQNNSSRPPPLFDEVYDVESEEPPTRYQYQQQGRVSIYGGNNVSLNTNINSRPPPLLSQPPSRSSHRPPPLFRGNPPIKRSVPHADPGQPFQVPGMIPPGVFQPPRKYFSNRPKAPAKKKKRSEPGPQPPVPDEPQRPVPEFTQSRLIPQGSVLRAFPPPPLMNQNVDFAEDLNLF